MFKKSETTVIVVTKVTNGIENFVNAFTKRKGLEAAKDDNNHHHTLKNATYTSKPVSAGKDTPNNSNSQESGSELPANTDLSLRVDRDQLRAERERRKAAEKEAKQAWKETSKLLAKVA